MTIRCGIDVSLGDSPSAADLWLAAKENDLSECLAIWVSLCMRCLVDGVEFRMLSFVEIP